MWRLFRFICVASVVCSDTGAWAAESKNEDQLISEAPRALILMFGDATDATSRGLLALVRDVAKEFGEDVELAWIPLWSDTDKRGVAIAMALEAARVQKRFWKTNTTPILSTTEPRTRHLRLTPSED